nr:MAG TPA: hypothetical protein [Microviridae sp.]
MMMDCIFFKGVLRACFALDDDEACQAYLRGCCLDDPEIFEAIEIKIMEVDVK